MSAASAAISTRDSGGSDLASLHATVATLHDTVAVLQSQQTKLIERVESLMAVIRDVPPPQFEPERIVPTLHKIKMVVCRKYNLHENELVARRAKWKGVKPSPRQVACWLACRLSKLPITTIAPLLGYSEHSGVCDARDTVESLRLDDVNIERELKQLELEICEVPTKPQEASCPASSSGSPA